MSKLKPKTMNLNVRVSGNLSEFVAAAIGDAGSYDNASEYVRDLIRQDKSRAEREAFEAKRAALQAAFALPDSAYSNVTVEDVIRRNRTQR